VLDRHYNGQFQSVNFSQSTAAAKIINDFVEQATRGKIKDLIDPSGLDGMTRLILVNAIYFKGSWQSKFMPQSTKQDKFYVKEGVEKMVDMMHQKQKFVYSADDSMQVLGMPYVGEDVYMYVFLPKERFGLAALLKSLNGKKLMDTLANKNKEEVIVSLPKFKVESTHGLVPILKEMGISKAFSRDANFNGISTAGQLYISDVIQKAFVEVNEEGTEAAAATGVVMMARSSLPRNPSFKADQPFAYVIEQNGSVLFGGVYQ